MEVIKGFCDLSVSDNQSEEDLKSTLHMLAELGYSTVAINYALNETIFKQRDKKKNQVATDLIPPPKSIDSLKKEFKDTLKIFQRVTITISDKDQAHKLSQSENLINYNLVAVIPTTDVLLQFACTDMKIDIISFDPGCKQQLKVKRNMYNMAVERGVFFELMYAPAILDSSCRRNIICMGHMYHTFGKSKNIVITSGASNYFQVRGPYDIINLALLFGLSEEQAKGAITTTCRSLLLTAAGRCCGQAVVLVKRVAKSSCKRDEMEVDTEDTKRIRLDSSGSDDGD